MILITGGDGYVGQKLVPLAKKLFKGKEILCLIHNGQEDFEKNGRKILKKAKIKTLEVDLVTGKNLKKIPKNPELVIHLAANTDTSKKDHRVNDLGTKNLLDAIGPLNPKTYFLYTSTTVLMSGRKNCSVPLFESEPPSATNEYGRSKARAEGILKDFQKKWHFKLTIIRINTIYGKDPRDHKMFKVLSKSIRNNSLVARLNWPGLTSLIFIDDVVDALLRISKIKPKSEVTPEYYNLTAEALTMSQISKMMYQRMNLKYQPLNLPNSFWKLLSVLRPTIPFLEPILPLQIYNIFWRTGLIVDDVINSSNKKIKKTLPHWRPKKLSEVIDDVID